MDEQKTNPRVVSRPGCILLAALLLLAGCQPASTKGVAEADSAAQAQAVLDQMLATYRGAKTYADSGDLVFRATRDGQIIEDQPLPFSVTFERPGKLRLHLVGALLVSDGQHLFASARHIPEQVLQLPAAEKLDLASVARDAHLLEAMNNRLPELISPQLELLLADEPLAAWLAGSKLKLLPEEKLNDVVCQRVEILRADGPCVLWIDKQDHLLRRCEFSTGKLKERLDADGQLTKLEAWLDLRSAKLDAPVDPVAFQFEVPATAKTVGRFVPPVAPLEGPIGQEIGVFRFYDLDGRAVDREALARKMAVLDFWSTTCGECRQNAPGMQRLYEKYKDHPQVLFLAVSSDPPVIAGELLISTLRQWGAALPIVRDSEKYREKSLQIDREPATILLGPDGRVHAFTADRAAYPTELDWGIRELLEGTNVAKQKIDEQAALEKQFELELAKATVDAATDVVAAPQTKIAAASEPATLKLSKLWESESIKSPGNLLVVPASEGDTPVMVFDGLGTRVSVDGQGKDAARHELPEGAIASFLRTGVDGAGKRYFAASAINQQQLYLLDDAGKLLLAYPTERHPGIADVQFGDLKGDGELELLIGYWGAAGVQGVSLTGERLWSNRSLANVLEIAVSQANPLGRSRALCFSTRGTLTPIDSHGEAEAAIRVRGRTLTHLASEDVDSDAQRELCALAVDPQDHGRMTAIGLDDQGQELWSYELPAGNHQYAVERLVPARLAADDGGWLLPTADGSIHLLTKDGALVDRFNTGAAITGLGLARFGGSPVLLIATPERLTAWKIDASE